MRFPLQLALHLVLLALMAGCATVEAPRIERAPALTPDPGVSPNFVVPGVRERMVTLARQEWRLFGRPVIRDHEGQAEAEFEPGVRVTHEVQSDMLSRVLMYWYAATDQPIVGHQGELRPWSAVFIVWLARGAGLTRSEFPSTALHWDYIAHALDPDSGAGFIVRDARSHAPAVGDLLCAPRGAAFIAEVTGIDRLRHGGYHCDLVVEVREHEIDVIGGNVNDTVALTRVARDAAGRAVRTPRRPWVVVLQKRGQTPVDNSKQGERKP